MLLDRLTKSSFFKFIIGVLSAAVTTLAVLALLAAVAAVFGASGAVLKAFSVAARLLAACVCAYFFCSGRRAILNGILAGLASFIGVFIVYGIFSGVPSVPKLLIGVAFSLIFALAFSIIFVNFKKTGDNC